ncbi:MAG: nitroreductase [Pseudomonadota bacterium]
MTRADRLFSTVDHGAPGRPPLGREHLYPTDAGPRERLRFALSYAVLAPSSHNSQPWRFDLHEDHLCIHADLTHRLEITDPDCRELMISIGALIETLAVALRHFGHLGDVEVLPEPNAPWLAARVGLGGSYEPSDVDQAVFDAIETRATYRFPFADQAVPNDVTADLQDACRQFGPDLHIMRTQDERHMIADLIAEGDKRQFADPAFRAELSNWIHPRRGDTHDGMSGEVFGMPGVLTGVGAFAIRTFDLGDKQAARDRDIAEHSPVLATLVTPTDQPADWIACGRALAATLLTATAHGVSASFLNQPIEVPDLRRDVADHLGLDGMPQLILRFGYPNRPVPPLGPRRPLSSMLTDM